MITNLQLITILLIINLVIAVIYVLAHLKTKDKKKIIISFFLFIVFPITAELFVMFGSLIEKLLEYLKKQGLDMKELSFNKEKMRLRQEADLEELNKVPIEEALIVHDKKNKRNAFLDVLKSDDYAGMMDQVHNAVENEDIEVAHYAAVFISDSTAKFKNGEAALFKKITDEADALKLSEYIVYMCENMNPEVLSIAELKNYMERLNKFAWDLYELNNESLKDIMVVHIVEFLKVLDDEEKISKWIQLARNNCLESLEYIKLCARYYFANNDRKNLSELIALIKISSVSLDSETLDWFRAIQL